MIGRCNFTSDETGATHQEIIDDLMEEVTHANENLVAANLRSKRMAAALGKLIDAGYDADFCDKKCLDRAIPCIWCEARAAIAKESRR